MVNSNQPLINLRDKWILIDQQDLEELRNAKDLDVSNYMDALKLGLTGSIQLGENGNRYEVIVEGAFGEIIDNLKSIDKFENIPPPSSFRLPVSWGALPAPPAGFSWWAGCPQPAVAVAPLRRPPAGGFTLMVLLYHTYSTGMTYSYLQ